MTARGEERRWLDVDSGASGELRALLESARDDGGEREQIERIRGRLGVLIGPAFGGEGPPTPPEPGPPQAPDASLAPAAAPPVAPAPPPPLGATAGKVAFGKALALKPLLVGISIGALGGSAVTWQVSSALHAPVAASASAAVSAAPKGVRVAPAMPPRTDEAPVAPPAVPAVGTPVEVARVDEGALAAKGPAEAATLAEPGQAPGLEPLAPSAPVSPGGPPGALPVAPAPTGGETTASPPIAAQTPASPPIAAQAPASPPASTTIANADAAVKPPAIVAAGPPAAPRTAPNTPANEVPWAIFDDPYLALPTPPSSAPAAATPGRPLAPAAATPGRPTAPAAALPGRPTAPAAAPPGRPPSAGPAGLPAAPGVTLPGFPPPPGAAPPGPPRAAVFDGAPATGSATAAASAVPPLRLVDEVRLLRAAQEALVHAPARAFELTEEHRRRFPAGSLVQEREVFAVEALWRTGRRGVALERAKRFLAAHPDSSHAARLRSLVGVEK